MASPSPGGPRAPAPPCCPDPAPPLPRSPWCPFHAAAFNLIVLLLLACHARAVLADPGERPPPTGPPLPAPPQIPAERQGRASPVHRLGTAGGAAVRRPAAGVAVPLRPGEGGAHLTPPPSPPPPPPGVVPLPDTAIDFSDLRSGAPRKPERVRPGSRGGGRGVRWGEMGVRGCAAAPLSRERPWRPVPTEHRPSRARRTGRCVTAVRHTDRLAPTTAASATAACAAWTTTAPGRHLRHGPVPGHEGLCHGLFQSLGTGECSERGPGTARHPSPVCLSIHRINNCVGELNQKYFIQFLFYAGECSCGGPHSL